jgi:hypothetical protein
VNLKQILGFAFKLQNNYSGYQIVAKVVHGYSKIVANGRAYDSIVEAVAAGEAKDRFFPKGQLCAT